MSYAGNPSLNEETKARIRTTFGQTVQLAQAGRLQEASLGCDFILKMDPQFAPARSLLDRLDGASGPIDVAGLLPEESAPAAAPTSAPPLEAPSLEAPPLEAPAAPSAASPLPPVPGAPSSPVASPPGGGTPDSASALPSLDAPSLDPPAQPAPSLSAPSLGAAPLDTGASSSTSSGGDDDRIQSLLDEGQSSFDAGEYQAAIDAWSRVFLIDIDHEEASNRIEQARLRKDESDRELEETFHRAVDNIESGSVIEGRAMLEELLERRPDHHGARERLNRLDAAGDPGSAEPAPVAGLPAPEPLPDSSPSLSDVGMGLDASEEIADALSSVEGASTFAPPPPAATAASGGRRNLFADRRFVYIAAGASLVVLGVGWFLLNNWGVLFPNGPSLDPIDTPIVRTNPIAEATKLHLSGDVEGAIALLENLPESSPRYDRAQEQITEWRRELELAAEAERSRAEGAASAERQRDSLLESARRAYGERRFLMAAKQFNAASKIAALDGPAADLFEDAKRQLVPIQQQITFFREGDWERIQAPLWRLLESDPDNQDALLLLTDSYYNLGVQSLRRGLPDEAYGHLAEANRLAPDDAFIARLMLLSSTYRGNRNPDLLYSIFVEELPFRR